MEDTPCAPSWWKIGLIYIFIFMNIIFKFHGFERVAVPVVMLLPLSVLLALLVHRAIVLATPAKRSYDTHYYYALEHDRSAMPGASLDVIAQALGVQVVEQVGELKDLWLVRALKPLHQIRSEEQGDHVLRAYEHLRAVANQGDSSLAKRSEVHNARRIVSSIQYFSKQTLRRRDKRAPPPISPPDVASERAIAARLGIRDPLFPRQWHLINDEYPEHMMNVTGLWAMGYTGKGVISSFVDDGLDYNSEDIKANFVGICHLPTGHINISFSLFRMLTILTTSMTTKTCPPRNWTRTVMALVVLAKLPPLRMMHVVLESHTNLKLLAFASCLVQYRMLTRQRR